MNTFDENERQTREMLFDKSNPNYSVAMKCSNCGHEFTLLKPKGETTRWNETCPYCECNTASRKP